jgi:uncharacterized protein (TIGR02147 family)
MTEIYKFMSYKEYIEKRIKAMPRNGHGQMTRLASHVGVNPVIVTQVLKGERDFNEEQGLRVANYFGLNSIETEYFMRLVAFERSGTHDLKQFHRHALETLKKQAMMVKNRVAEHRELDDSTKSVFYSDWAYSAVRLLTSVPDTRTPEALAERLGLSHGRIAEIVDFLLMTGLCKVDERGRLTLGVSTTHIDAQSRFVNNHRRNWRLKGLDKLNRTTPDELFYSGPCTLSESDFNGLKSDLIQVISSLSKRVSESKPEFLACINLDLFKV